MSIFQRPRRIKYNMINTIKIAAFLTTFGFVTGCLNVGPEYHRSEPEFEIPTAYHQVAPLEGPAVSQMENWWRVFKDPVIDGLVEQVLLRNLEIQKAAARILEIRFQLKRTRANRYPSVDLSARWEKQRQPFTNVLTGESDHRTTEGWSLYLPASYELDLWGRLARAEEAARADLLQAEQARRTVVQTIVAETVNLYLEVEAIERQIQVLQKSIGNFRQSLDHVERRYNRGLTSSLDVRQARRILAEAKTLLPPLEQRLGIAEQQLSVLAGQYPRTRPARLQPEDYFKRLVPVPAGLPSDLLQTRPDILAAEARLKALNAQVAQATATRFPRVTLTGNYGYASESVKDLFQPESLLWNLATGLTQPVFDAGRLKAGQEGAEARYQQGVAEYAQAVLTAFAEVEGALLRRQKLLIRREKVLILLEEARAVERVAQQRYQRGLTDYLTVLDAQRARISTEDSLIQTDLAIYQNRVSLHRALGGNWSI